MGTPPTAVIEFVETPQAAKKALLTSANTKGILPSFRILQDIVPIWD